MRFALEVLFAILTIAITEISTEIRNSTESDEGPGNRLEEFQPLESDASAAWKTDGSSCAHKDYRTYIKCLLRHRRYEPAHATGRVGGSNCVEECERESCRRQSPGSCADVCYDRCMKKTKEIHHRITEYETACDDGEDCDRPAKSGPSREPAAFANLTTSIDIRNYVNNTNVVLTAHQGSGSGEKIDATMDRESKDHENRGKNWSTTTCRDGDDGCSDNGIEDGHRRPATPPRAPQPGFQPWYPAPSLALIPQIQMVPQVTFGLGISPAVGFGSIGAGCPYASIWLCIPQHQQQQQQIPDCSGCEHPRPYRRGRCDPSC